MKRHDAPAPDEMDDLFGHVPEQPHLLPVPPQPRPLTADDVRDKMLSLIAQLRAADAMPFAPPELKKHRAMFPIMAQWLAPDDGAQLLIEFEDALSPFGAP